MDMSDILAQWDAMQKKNHTEKSYEHTASSGQKKTTDTPRQISHKKPNAPSALTSPNKASHERNDKSSSDKNTRESMEKWLEKHGVENKDRAAYEKAQRKAEKATNYANLPIDETIDLHGLTQDEAESALDVFIANAKRHGSRKILIIHGKGIHSSGGEGVLGHLVQNYIERDKRCGASGHPKNADGATGATWVVLK